LKSVLLVHVFDSRTVWIEEMTEAAGNLNSSRRMNAFHGWHRLDYPTVTTLKDVSTRGSFCERTNNPSFATHCNNSLQSILDLTRRSTARKQEDAFNRLIRQDFLNEMKSVAGLMLKASQSSTMQSTRNKVPFKPINQSEWAQRPCKYAGENPLQNAKPHPPIGDSFTEA